MEMLIKALVKYYLPTQNIEKTFQAILPIAKACFSGVARML